MTSCNIPPTGAGIAMSVIVFAECVFIMYLLALRNYYFTNFLTATRAEATGDFYVPSEFEAQLIMSIEFVFIMYLLALRFMFR
jgi:hypothetical protein